MNPHKWKPCTPTIVHVSILYLDHWIDTFPQNKQVNRIIITTIASFYCWRSVGDNNCCKMLSGNIRLTHCTVGDDTFHQMEYPTAPMRGTGPDGSMNATLCRPTILTVQSKPFHIFRQFTFYHGTHLNMKNCVQREGFSNNGVTDNTVLRIRKEGCNYHEIDTAERYIHWRLQG